MAGTITYIAPVDYGQGKIFGKKNKWTAVKRSFGNKQKGCSYGGDRNMLEHPITEGEIAQHETFGNKAKLVNARLKMTSSTYEQDLAAFIAQRDLPGGYKTMKKYLWHV